MNSEHKTGLKERLVEAVYDMIVEVGAENIRVRDLSRRVGCSVSALYKHFDSLDYLLGLASLRFLQPYIEELRENLQRMENVIQGEIDAWKLFNKYAFQYPYLFLTLFWSNREDFMESVLQEYFEMYPLAGKGEEPALFYSSIFSGSIEERDFIWFRRAAAEGWLRYDDARYVSQVNCLIARGMLHQHLYDYRDPAVYESAVARCNDLIEKNIRMYLI